jgi:SulP family sulfate permease
LHSIWLRLFPFLRWRNELTRTTVRDDVVAGLTGAVLVMAQGVAFAAIAGMPPEYGLYAAMVPTIIAALYGSSRHLVSGPTTAASIVVFTSLSALAEPGSIEFVQLAISLTFMVGIIELTLGVARLGILVNFISDAVIVGFTAGAAVLIGAHQLKTFSAFRFPRACTSMSCCPISTLT